MMGDWNKTIQGRNPPILIPNLEKQTQFLNSKLEHSFLQNDQGIIYHGILILDMEHVSWKGL